MNVLGHLNEAMAYIEKNLDGDIDVQYAAQIACCSEYHFRRMFSFLSGMSLGEYIRNRRLAEAALVLSNTDEKVIDVALQFGYESPDAFSKAFRAMHGITPMQVRKSDVSIQSFTPMTFQLNIKGGHKMDYRIIEKGAFNIIGVSGRIPLIYNGANSHTADVWKKLRQEDLLVLMEYSVVEPKGILNVYANYEDKTVEGTTLDYFVGIVADAILPERLMERYNVLTVEASTWAVFTSVGKHPDAAQETWARIADTWFPSSDYEMTGAPELMWYESYDFGKFDFKTEIWLPVRKANNAAV
ncbi:MAG: AraC family transcriptional regulator [Oscillospiraceae bacterium]|nr:AraC family transcriptional regulator [Oscillospiraceae bacterium]